MYGDDIVLNLLRDCGGRDERKARVWVWYEGENGWSLVATRVTFILTGTAIYILIHVAWLVLTA